MSESDRERGDKVREVNRDRPKDFCVRMVMLREAATICAYEILLPLKSEGILEC